MTFPVVLLCCRCCRAVRPDEPEAKRWSTFTHMGRTTVDICPACASILLRVLRETPAVIDRT